MVDPYTDKFALDERTDPPALILTVSRWVSAMSGHRYETRAAKTSLVRRLAWPTAILLSVGVALVSYRYVARVGPVPPNIARNRFLHPWIMIHAGAAATALLLGPLQFLPAVRRRWPRAHRWTGRAYVAGCLAGGVSALVLAAGVSTGAVAGAGFASLGVLWIGVTLQGWRTARARLWAQHRRWMIRSIALTGAAVTLRIYLPVSAALQVDFVVAYRIIAWLAWVPNAVFAEWYLRATGARPAAISRWVEGQVVDGPGGGQSPANSAVER